MIGHFTVKLNGIFTCSKGFVSAVYESVANGMEYYKIAW